MLRDHSALLVTLFFALLFVVGTASSAWKPERTKIPEGQVVIPAPVQLLVFAGDRYLAANVEAIRAVTITLDNQTDHQRAIYRLRSHRTVTRLNPCHEDNYFFGNATLTWGGMEKAGNDLLRQAMECRFWDFIPAFYYGFNEYFFYHDIDKAYEALQIAAQRADKNRAPLRKLAIMIKAESMDDETLAVNYLRHELENARDSRLKKMLSKRLTRLQGLITLRQAQREYQQATGKPLQKPGRLIEKGYLSEFPRDPLGLGYEFIEGEFRLRTRKIVGLDEHT